MRSNQILRIVSFILFFFIYSMPFVLAQVVKVQVTPKHEKWVCEKGDNVLFEAVATENNIPLQNVILRYEISEDMMKPHITNTVIQEKEKINISGGIVKKASFIRCKVIVEHQGKEYSGMATVGCEPETIEPIVKLPSDFLEFWNKAKSEVANLPLNVRSYLVPEKSTDKTDVYHVSFQVDQHGARLYGMLCVPKAEGKYPTILKVPGAGLRAYDGDMEKAEQGFVTLEIGIHGIPVDLSTKVYHHLAAGALRDYPSINLDNRDSYYYKRVYLGCVRAVDYLCSLPQVDNDNVVVYGGSQGGALSIVTAALNSKVKGIVTFYPALCDLTGYVHNRAGGWPHMFAANSNQTKEKEKTAQYYDVVNFARELKVPVFFSCGYNDLICPPTTTMAAFNSITSPKQLLLAEETGHYLYTEQKDSAWSWVKELIKK